jgi:predicted enzyme related to lactoylglutathione lyase
MAPKFRYMHTNLIATDWRRLAQFYEEVFGCRPVPPERSFSGRAIDELTGIHGAGLSGIHMLLPGRGDTGPTLEIFSYRQKGEGGDKAVNRPGFAHIAFAVDDVRVARDAVIAAGGRPLGEIVTLDVTDLGQGNFAYVTDPEGNVVELQKWEE